MKIAVILAAMLQGFLALTAVVAIGEPVPELLPVILSLIGAVGACVVALNGFPRSPAFVAAGVSAAAIACYCVLPVVIGGEFKVGFAMVVQSPLIILFFGPPATTALLLFVASTTTTPQPLAKPPAAAQDGRLSAPQPERRTDSNTCDRCNSYPSSPSAPG